MPGTPCRQAEYTILPDGSITVTGFRDRTSPDGWQHAAGEGKTMSHYSRVKTLFRHREALIACLKNLGYEVETDITIGDTTGTHGGYRRHPDQGVRHRVCPERRRDLRHGRGLVGGYRTGERKIAQQLKDQAGAIQKEYARSMVLSQAVADGFELVSQTSETDGTIRIVMRRWD